MYFLFRFGFASLSCNKLSLFLRGKDFSHQNSRTKLTNTDLNSCQNLPQNIQFIRIVYFVEAVTLSNFSTTHTHSNNILFVPVNIIIRF